MSPREKATEPKKNVVLGFPLSAYQALVREAAHETAKRGYTVSVPKLLVEIVLAWLDGRTKK